MKKPTPRSRRSEPPPRPTLTIGTGLVEPYRPPAVDPECPATPPARVPVLLA